MIQQLISEVVGQMFDEIVSADGVVEVLLQVLHLAGQIHQFHEDGEGQPEQNVAHQAPTGTPALTMRSSETKTVNNWR